MNTDVLEIPIPLGGYTIKVCARDGYERNPAPRVYVADAVAETRSAALVELELQEQALGKRRFAQRGQHTDVDALYDRLNAEIMRVKLEIAHGVLCWLKDYVSGDFNAADDRAFFSRNAGCDMCPCSPGVVAGAKLTWDDWNGAEFDVWVEAV